VNVLEKDLSMLTEILEMGEDGDFSLDIRTSKKRKLETRTVSIFMESALYKDIINRPFIFILLPFFSPKRQRNLNIIYEIENAGIKFSSSLSSDPLEEFTNKQPGEFEKNALDFIMWKFQRLFLEEEDKATVDLSHVEFSIDELIEYLGLKFHSSYYKKVEEALYNLQETTYRVRIKNQKKAGNIIREVYEKPLNLIRYRKTKEQILKGGKPKVKYEVELDYRLIQELKIKHYSIFDKELLNELRAKNKTAERIYQFISMKRFTSNQGEFRIETLASIIPLNLYSIIKKQDKDGNIKQYRVSKKKTVLNKLKKTFDDLVELEYLLKYEMIELSEEKSFKIHYYFNPEKDNKLHKSTYLSKEMKACYLGDEIEKQLSKNCTNPEFKNQMLDFKKRLKANIADYSVSEILEVLKKMETINSLKVDFWAEFKKEFTIKSIEELEVEEAKVIEGSEEEDIYLNIYKSLNEAKRKEIDKIAEDFFKDKNEDEYYGDLSAEEKKEYLRGALKVVLGI
jgi:hypothetical protein